MAELFKVIGLMSGTSLDGVDVAYCHFQENEGNWEFQIIDTETVEYPTDIKVRIKDTMQMTGVDLVKLDFDLGLLYGELVNDFVERYNIDVDLVSSHGHTIYHQPHMGITFQAGNGHAIHSNTGYPVVCDFRTQDVIMGGQGAPLVPVGDTLLFPQYSACINLGGIANISFGKNSERVAYDICPANMPLNIVAGELGHSFDKDGEIARTGEPDNILLESLNNLDYYSQPGPKSMGYEWVKSNIISQLGISGLSDPDKLSTLVEHSAIKIADELNNNIMKGSVLVTGGGALNTYLIERIRNHVLDRIELEIPDKQLVIYKEALIFALLGVLRWKNEINVYRSATGSKKDHSAGIILGNNT